MSLVASTTFDGCWQEAIILTAEDMPAAYTRPYDRNSLLGSRSPLDDDTRAQFPALRFARTYHAILKAGDILRMPDRCFHSFRYRTAALSVNWIYKGFRHPLGARAVQLMELFTKDSMSDFLRINSGGPEGGQISDFKDFIAVSRGRARARQDCPALLPPASSSTSPSHRGEGGEGSQGREGNPGTGTSWASVHRRIDDGLCSMRCAASILATETQVAAVMGLAFVDKSLAVRLMTFLTPDPWNWAEAASYLGPIPRQTPGAPS